MKNKILHSIKIALPGFLLLVALNVCQAQPEIDIGKTAVIGPSPPHPNFNRRVQRRGAGRFEIRPLRPRAFSFVAPGTAQISDQRQQRGQCAGLS